jgi:DNA segregation ATPase FtsK/SpoIIIE-like protein
VPLKGYIDRVERENGKLKIFDYKTCYSFSNPEKIDGAKIIQAVEYYLLCYAKYGEEPYSVTFQEAKYTKNADGGKQVREYEIVFADNELYFDFYFRFYEDMTRALNGEMVYVPNVHAMFDNEIGIIAYIHRLDISEETAKLMKKHKVQNISELLKRQIQSAGNMRKLMKTIEASFVEAKNIDYSKMENHDKIRTKLMEHGMIIDFHSVLEGSTVDLYQFIPSMGLKMKRLRSYVEDIEQVLGISGVRVLAPIPNSTMVGFEVPRRERTFPSVPAGDGFDIAIGQTIMGGARRFDFRTAPHIMVAGSSGSGKSVFLNGFIEQVSRIPNVELHLFDPKRVELSHHKSNKATVEYLADIGDIYQALGRLEEEMTARYKRLEKAKVRNIEGVKDMPYKVVIIDEFGELITAKMVDIKQESTGHIITRGQHAGEEKMTTVSTDISGGIETKLLRLAQMGRAAGIHLVIATQTPRADIVKGTIKANFPTKVVFRTAKAMDSIVVLDELGAEKLAGRGDMLFAGDNGLERLQGFNI